ncbi:hypothetical protein ABDK56_04490 [Sphingomonas sp. ASV193]|uniref:hypothetical protein n=1 Tax=Sphingomonas sp. ASV193 TaxID=3144405 RepID=UPI0032E8FBC3
MRTRLGLALMAAIAVSGAASPVAPPGAPATPVVLHLSNFRFGPKMLFLKRGQDYTLTLASDGGAHSFFAPAFFAQARVAPAERALIDPARGIEVPSRGAITLHLTAPMQPGRYRFKCTHALHNLMGMNGEIVVR